jgi:UDPglucose 6-dehydrogenase
VVSNPEFLREGSAIEDFMRPDRVVIGARDPQAIAIMKDIYSPLYLIETPFVITNVESSELIKYASNAFLATKVAFINEIANLCEKVGADVTVVARAMGFDPRIGRKFLNPGPGFGGSCFPKDVKALVHQGREAGEPMRILEAVLESNERQKRRAVEKAEALLGKLSGKTVAVLGLSFKPNTSDVRESPALTVVPELLKRGARVRVYDPVAREEFRRWMPDLKVDYARNPLEAARGAHALIILTEWNEFRFLDLAEIKKLMAEPNLIDMRNIYEPETVKALGFRYTGVGRN